MIDKAIFAKIRKCLALSKSANEHEAAAALAKARELMDQHGIDEAALELAEIEEATARASRNVRPPLWENILSATVCHALAVTVFIDAHGDRTFIGRGPRAEVAGYAFAVLFRQLKKARAAYITSALRRCKPGRKRQRADVYCEGWAQAVLVKIRKLVPEPSPDEALERYLAVQHPGLVAVGARGAKMTRASNDYWNGVVAGHLVDLNAGVGEAAKPLELT
ncbi:MAG: DUF2786 domain-containing protein [Novosphingobium sp.]